MTTAGTLMKPKPSRVLSSLGNFIVLFTLYVLRSLYTYLVSYVHVRLLFYINVEILGAVDAHYHLIVFRHRCKQGIKRMFNEDIPTDPYDIHCSVYGVIFYTKILL